MRHLLLNLFFGKLAPILNTLDFNYELIFVNDGSQDNTLETLLTFQKSHPSTIIINLSRNFGKEAALTAGLENAKGDIIIPIDIDLQDPPELIPVLIEEWKKGYEQVIAIRSNRAFDSLAKRITSKLFYKAFNRISDRKIPYNAGDYRLLDRKVANALLKLPERNRFMKGLFNWVGYKTTFVSFDRQRRATGKTSWNYFKLWKFALDGIFFF